MTEVVFFYVTAPDEASAAAIADALVSEGLAACVNIFPRIRSVYRWKGAVERGEEAALIVKTTIAKAAAARTALERAHPYETPVIAALGIDSDRSGAAFIDWISSELSETFP
jgi:periplasmic divalent cation tolerance protein